MHIRLQLGSTLGPIGIHTCSESDYLCVSVQASPILQICHLAQKTQCLGSHLPRPLVVYTTMTMKVCKDGPWQKFYPPSRGKGVTGKKWQAALKRKEVAEDKAEKSQLASNKADVVAATAEVAFTKADLAAAIAEAKAEKLKKAFEKADAKAKKLKIRAQLNSARADAI